MKYALQELVSFITTSLNPANRMRAVPTDGQLKQWSLQIVNLRSKAQSELQDISIDTTSTISFHDFVERYQCLLVQAMNILYADKLKNCQDPTRDLREQGLAELDSLYQLLADFYSNHFDMCAPMPYWRLDRACYQLRHHEKKIRKALFERQADVQLTDIVLEPYHSFMGRNSEPFTKCSCYLHYLNTLLEHIRRCLHSSHADINEALHQLLLTNNFNRPEFIHYYYKKLTEPVQAQSGPVGQLSVLYDCLNTIKQTICYHQYAYAPNMLSVKDALTDWLQHGIFIIEQRLRVDEVPAFAKASAGKAGKEDEEYEQLGVSVDVYSLHKRIERDVGMLVNKNVTQMINCIAKNCRRKDLQLVSAVSFRQSYYSPERYAKKELERYYKMMLLRVSSI